MKKLNVLAGVFLISLLAFAVSCVTKEYQVTQTYYETEMRQESYVATEEYEIKTPHSATIFQMDDEYCIPHFLFLFNEGSNGTTRWCNGLSAFKQAKTFRLEPEGRNHRICVTAREVSVAGPEYATDQAVVVGLMTGRAPAAIDLGFKPKVPACPGVVFMRDSPVLQLHPDWIKRSSWYKSSGLIGALNNMERSTEEWRAMLLAEPPESRWAHNLLGDSPIESLNVVGTDYMKTVMLDLCAAGYYGSPSEIVKEEQLTGLQHPIEFSLDQMFQTDGWALIYITSLPFETHCFLTLSVDYVWDDVEIGTREVTKYRDVPVQVEKQRTVTETRQVPFWEAIFGE